uniref:Uncharacterized protein n=1 Tax=Knipowitschia caucasica TaxID=637954 RepID=A0AAV2JK55_KNICA
MAAPVSPSNSASGSLPNDASPVPASPRKSVRLASVGSVRAYLAALGKKLEDAGRWLTLEAANGLSIPYLGYVILPIIIEFADSEGAIGYVRTINRNPILIPARSEVLLSGWTKGGIDGKDYQCLVEPLECKCSKKQKERLQALLHKHRATFASSDEDYGLTTTVQHVIPTADAPPIRERYRQIPPQMYQEVKALIQGMLDSEIILPSTNKKVALKRLCMETSYFLCLDQQKNQMTITGCQQSSRGAPSATVILHGLGFGSLPVWSLKKILML